MKYKYFLKFKQLQEVDKVTKVHYYYISIASVIVKSPYYDFILHMIHLIWRPILCYLNFYSNKFQDFLGI